MERKSRRTFSLEFKKLVLAQIESGEKTLSEAALEHDLGANVICRWRREMREGVINEAVAKAPRVESQGIDPRYVRQLEEELRKSREKIGELILVNDFLKKIDPTSPRMKNVSTSVVTDTTLAQLKRRAK